MASTTKGSIKISTANEIGTALVDKLGGEGYAPETWSDNINLCGIAEADKEAALSAITDSAGTGEARGSILLSTANKIGAMLNKKYSTDRGFKPKEWASAIDQLTPLTVKTASGAIASFSDGAEDVPVKSCVVSFTPSGGGGSPSQPVSIQGVSGLSVTRTGKNLLENTASSTTESNVTFTVNSDGSVSLSGIASAEINFNIYSNFSFPKTGNYFISGCTSGGSTSTFRIFATNYGSDTGNGLSVNVTNLATKTTIRINIKSGVNTDGLVFKPMISVGSTATTYSPYVTPSVVTDTFGQTIYGGTRDLVTDKATSYGYLYDLGSNNWNADANRSGVFYSNVSASGREAGSDVLGCECFDVMNINVSTSQDNYISGKPSYGGAIIFIRCTDFAGYTGAQVKEALTGLKACLKTATPTEITGLTPHEINTLLGDNNFYADTGDTSVEYRADIDLAT